MDAYYRCAVCRRVFPANHSLEGLGRGRRIAYDPGRGRLWVVCDACGQWSLLPMESRWEALSELEKLVTDEGRCLRRTENVALVRVRKLDLIRIGPANLREESWWRYSRALRHRRQRHMRLTAAGSAAAAGALAGSLWITGSMSFVALWLLLDRKLPSDGARWFRFGSAVWPGGRRCPSCGDLRGGSLPYDRRRLLVAAIGRDGRLEARIPCSSCGKHVFVLRGQEGASVLRRVLAYHHYSGASPRQIERAAALVEAAGGPGALPGRLLKKGKSLSAIGSTGAVALEIAFHDQAERRVLAMEAAAAEAHWRREEELAAIIDGELTSGTFANHFRRRIQRRNKALGERASSRPDEDTTRQ